MHSTVMRAYKRWIGEIVTFLIKHVQDSGELYIKSRLKRNVG